MSPIKKPRKGLRKTTVKKKKEAAEFPGLTLPEFDVKKFMEDSARQQRQLLEDLAEPLDLSSSEDEIGSRGKQKGTPKDVARWMLEDLDKGGRLDHDRTVRHIQRDFGGGFLYMNQNGNRAIVPEVLKEFRKLTEKTVVWVKRERFWRWRESHDFPGRREAD